MSKHGADQPEHRAYKVSERIPQLYGEVLAGQIEETLGKTGAVVLSAEEVSGAWHAVRGRIVGGQAGGRSGG